MKKAESFPPSLENSMGELSEIFQHPVYLNGSERHRREIMYKSSRSKYQAELEKPWDRYFEKDLRPLLAHKEVLDLGCFTGGRSVAWFQRYNLKSIAGIDVSPPYIKAAMNFAKAMAIKAHFETATAENQPFKNDTFDAILSYDVFEHVQEVSAVLNECYRVLKPGGRLFLVFPSYLHPTEHHLDLVTKMPAIHYLFSAKTLVSAYHEICQERGPNSDWYKRGTPNLEQWEKGNTLNGTTLARFRKLLKLNNWNITFHGKQPVGYFLRTTTNSRIFKLMSKISTLLIQFPILEDFLINRIVYILQKDSDCSC